ncbi:MAG TPA: hypothetical protein VKN18_22175 [Blastocatellia bacterium]|nr:hypothetical protein [Blastocatellia bacterium]
MNRLRRNKKLTRLGHCGGEFRRVLPPLPGHQRHFRLWISLRRFATTPVRKTLGAVLILSISPVLVHANGSKKVVYYGWGLPDTQYVRDHWREMEEMPLDGLGILVAINRKTWQQGVRGDGNQLGRQIMGPRAFHIEEFHDAIADLQSAHWRSFTDNFLPVALSLNEYVRGLNWFDDERWKIIANNFGVLSRIAAEAKLRGLIFDPEHYDYRLFSYSVQQKLQDRPFEDCTKMARQRGREVMKAVAAELPDATLLSFYGYTLLLSEMRGHSSLKETNYSLLPAFYDGLLEAMPSGACLVDGYEFSYGYKKRQDFVDSLSRIYHDGSRFTSVPDRYRAHVRAGFGLWLDRDQKFEYFTPEEFKESLTYALDVSDKYVWIYGQSLRFFPPRLPLPFVDAISAARRTLRTDR